MRSRRIRTEWLGAAVALAVALPALAGPPPPAFDSDPDQGPPGTVITVSGTGCTRPSEVGNQPGTNVHVELQGPQPGTAVVAQTDITPQGNTGDWTGQLTVPGGAQPGTYLITAICDPSDIPDDQPFNYAPNTFVVRPRQAGPPQPVPADVDFAG